MKSILFTITMLLGLSAFAQQKAPTKLVCSFTEPFFSYTYTFATRELSYESAEEPESKVVAGSADLYTPAFGGKEAFLMDSETQKVYVTLTREPGSNGMSDRVYQFSAEAGANIGGCDFE